MFLCVAKNKGGLCIPSHNQPLTTPRLLVLQSSGVYIYIASLCLPLPISRRIQPHPEAARSRQASETKAKEELQTSVPKRSGCSHAVFFTSLETQNDAGIIHSSFSESAEGTPGFCAVQLYRLVRSAAVGWMDHLLSGAKVTAHPIFTCSSWSLDTSAGQNAPFYSRVFPVFILFCDKLVAF